MTDVEATIDGVAVPPDERWAFEWVDREHAVALLNDGERSMLVLAEGQDSEWTVTVRGRRVPVLVRSWRERVLAEAETASRSTVGPVEVRATLPGLIVSVSVAAGDEVEEGAALLTIEAMKMQNEVRAPRAGRVMDVEVAPGQTVATGAGLLRLE